MRGTFASQPARHARVDQEVNKRFTGRGRRKIKPGPLCVVRTFGKHSAFTTNRLQSEFCTSFSNSRFVLMRKQKGRRKRTFCGLGVGWIWDYSAAARLAA
jgi:hypothetical protein